MPEFIFKINEAVVDDATGEAVMKPEYVQRLVRCASCNSCKIEFAIEDSSPFLNVEEDYKWRKRKTAEAWNRRVEDE